MQIVDEVADMVGDVADVKPLPTTEAGVEQILKVFEDLMITSYLGKGQCPR